MQDENNRLKGEPDRPKIPTCRPSPVGHSSEAERWVPRGRVKQAKKGTIPIDREKVGRDLLPPDAEFKGYEDVIVQDVSSAPTTCASARRRGIPAAHLPCRPADGQFGPTLKALIWI